MMKRYLNKQERAARDLKGQRPQYKESGRGSVWGQVQHDITADMDTLKVSYPVPPRV